MECNFSQKAQSGIDWQVPAQFISAEIWPLGTWCGSRPVWTRVQFISAAAVAWGSPAGFACGQGRVLLPPPGPPLWCHWKNNKRCKKNTKQKQKVFAWIRITAISWVVCTWGTPGRPSRCVKDPAHTSPVPASAATPPLKIHLLTKRSYCCPREPAQETYGLNTTKQYICANIPTISGCYSWWGSIFLHQKSKLKTLRCSILENMIQIQ